MFNQRIKNLKKKILEEKLDGVLISSVSNITYLTGYSNFSKDEREGYIFIGENFQYIITDGRYSEAIKREVSHLELYERGNGKSTEDLFRRHKEVRRLGIEENDLKIAEARALKKHFKNLKHFSLSRSIKDEKEIEKIEKAAKLGDKTFKFILGKIKSGITEKKLAFEIELFVKTEGGDISFPTIIGFGKNSSVPHHQTGDKRLTINDKLILMDFGVKFEDYCSDMTRTIFYGKPTEEQKKIYEIVLEAQQKAVDFTSSKVKSGKEVKAKEVDKIARDYIISKGYPSIPHSLGHGIGLEVHEHPHLSPKSKDILKEGMVFSIEPGVYIPEFGGVRIEDLFVLEKEDLRQLTNSPKEMLIV